MNNEFIELKVSCGNFNAKYTAYIRKDSIISIIEDNIGDKYPSTKISLINGDALNVWDYKAKDLMKILN